MATFGGKGLTNLTLVDLERLLRALHKEQLSFPNDPNSLLTAGLSYLVDRVDFLTGLDQRAVRAVLVAVIAERKHATRAS